MNDLLDLTSFKTSEKILIFSILFLLFSVLILIVYVFYLRVYYNLKNKAVEKKKARWEEVILGYLSGEDVSISIDLKDFMIFGDFIENYLMNFRGEEHENIIKFLKTKVWYGEILLKALKKSDKWSRAFAAHFLGVMKYARADTQLLELMYDKSPVVYLSAYEALNNIGSSKNLVQIIKTFLKIDNISKTKIIEILLGYGKSIEPILINLLDNDILKSDRKRILVEVLAFRGIYESGDKILKLAQETSDIELKIGCIKALGVLEHLDSVDFLTECLDSGNWVIKSQAAKALGLIGWDNAAQKLAKRLFYDENYWVKYYSAFALKKIGAKGNALMDYILNKSGNRETNDIINYIITEAD